MNDDAYDLHGTKTNMRMNELHGSKLQTVKAKWLFWRSAVSRGQSRPSYKTMQFTKYAASTPPRFRKSDHFHN